jgi:group I intron endonuclease
MKGIYKITVINTDLFYIGSSFDISKSFLEHVSLLKNKKHENYKLQNLFDKHGNDCLKLDIIQETPDLTRESLHLLKVSYFNLLNPTLNVKNKSNIFRT